MHLGLIGFGNIAGKLLFVLAEEDAVPTQVTVLVRNPLRVAPFGGKTVRFVSDAAALVKAGPDMVVECAGQKAVAGPVLDCLRAGIETVIASVGALADPTVEEAVARAARDGNARAVLPAGAIGAIDLLSALRASGITRLNYTGRKPPGAWSGTPAEALVDLAALTAPVCFFSGSAREAALEYPKNANVAATLAMAGPGFERTEVKLVADPTTTANIHEIEAEAGAGDFRLSVVGKPSPDNPKTSLATVYSLAREVMNRRREVVT